MKTVRVNPAPVNQPWGQAMEKASDAGIPGFIAGTILNTTPRHMQTILAPPRVDRQGENEVRAANKVAAFPQARKLRLERG